MRRKPKRDRSVVACVADTHCGHQLGLLNPATVLYQENAAGNDPVPYHPPLGPTQQYLWPLYMADLDELERIADGAPVHLWLVGDLTQGVRYTEHCFATSADDQARVAYWVIREALKRKLLVESVRIVRGTPSHTSDGETETTVVKRLRRKFRRTDCRIMYHGLFDIGGVTFDVAHHGPSAGIRTWTRGNQARYYLRSYMMQEIIAGEIPARYMIRAHFHEPLREPVVVGEWLSELFILPSYTGMNGHARQRTRSLHEQKHGMLVFELEAGAAKVHELYHTLDLREKERL